MNKESNETSTSRRDFFRRGARTAAVVGAAGLAGSTAVSSAAPPRRQSERIAAIKIDAEKVRDLAAGPEDRIYVAADKWLMIFSADGQMRSKTILRSAIQAVAVQADGRAVVATETHANLLGTEGQFLATRKFEGKASLTSVALAKDGDIFIADSGNKTVWKMKDDGRITGKIEAGLEPLKDFFPLAVDPTGNLNIADIHRHRVLRFSPEGEKLGSWGKKSRDLEGFGGCCNPVALAATTNGQFVTAEAGLPRIKMFTADGSFQALVAGPDEFEENARRSREVPETPENCHDGGFELAVDSKDRILVLDRVSKEVRIFA